MWLNKIYSYFCVILMGFEWSIHPDQSSNARMRRLAYSIIIPVSTSECLSVSVDSGSSKYCDVLTVLCVMENYCDVLLRNGEIRDENSM